MPNEQGLCKFCLVGDLEVVTIVEGRWIYTDLHICKECGKTETIKVNHD
jgi:hypothetical protein